MIRLQCAGLGLAVLMVVPGAGLQAGDKQVLLKLSGQQVSGGFTSLDPASGLMLSGSFNDVLLPDGTRGIFAFWNACLPPPPTPPPEPPPPLCPTMAAGILPASAASASGGAVTINFDTAKMILLFASSGPSAWKGTFSPYTGLFSTSAQTTGNQENSTVLPGFPDPATLFTIVQRTGGNRQQGTANFAGTVGPHAVAAPPMGANGSLFVHSGGTVSVQYTAP